MRDFPYRSPNGAQKIKINDPVTKSILSKMVKKIDWENSIFGDAVSMLTKIKKFTKNDNMTLRAIRRLATNNYYQNMWKSDDPDAEEKYRDFLFKMGHSEFTNKNTYLSQKEIFN